MTHLLSKIVFTNFRSITSEDFELSEFTPLVGCNNVGKTNILKWIKWLLRSSSLTKDDFNNSASPVIIEGLITGITEELLNSMEQTQRRSIENYISEGTLKIQRIQAQPWDWVRQIKLNVWIPNTDEWENNPNGIDNAISMLFPEPIHIGAMENSEEDSSKSKAGTTIGKLLAEIIDPIEATYGQQVRDALTGLSSLLDADGLTRAPELNNFDTAVNSKIDDFFPGINIKLHIPTPELKEVFTKGTIKVYEDNISWGKDIWSLWHWAQRSIQMSLIRHLAEIRRSWSVRNSTTLLLIDEPEIYLHPQAIEIVRDALKVLTRTGYQIIFSTHSPLMVTTEDVKNTILVRKNQQLWTHKRITLKSAVPQITDEAPSQLQLIFSLSNSSYILFSEKIIFIEWTTEQRVMPAIFERIRNSSFGISKIALIKLDGTGWFRKAMRVLDVMWLPNKSIVDLDYAFKNAVQENLISHDDPDIQACKSCLIELSEIHWITLWEDGYPTKRWSSMTPAEAFALLASTPTVTANINNLHDKLRRNNIWLWKKWTIEKHLWLNGKNEQIWADFVNRIKTTEAPENTITDYTSINDCINWLIS